MTDRRSLVEGIRTAAPPVDSRREKEFVYGGRPAADAAPAPAPVVSRVPVSTRIRADFAAALKRASLERQLGGVEPNTLQDILEQAIEPWLRGNGYLP